MTIHDTNRPVSVLYRSIACWPDLHPTDRDILAAALRFNRSAGITGFLWRANGQFFQALHGPRAALDALLGRIARDDRHHSVEVLLHETAPAPSAFAGWSMGYDHFLEASLGLQLGADGSRPPVNRTRAREILDAMVAASEEARLYGSVLPFARYRGESEERYLQRIERAG